MNARWQRFGVTSGRHTGNGLVTKGLIRLIRPEEADGPVPPELEFASTIEASDGIRDRSKRFKLSLQWFIKPALFPTWDGRNVWQDAVI
jgi:hypothetical protein